MVSLRPSRAYLAVPAHRARLVAKAAASLADAVFMDLEDAVPPAEKGVALEEAARSLSSLDWGHKRVAVRLNAVDSPFIADEIRALAALPRLDAVIVPKAERAGDIVAIADRLGAAAPKRSAMATMSPARSAFGTITASSRGKAASARISSAMNGLSTALSLTATRLWPQSSEDSDRAASSSATPFSAGGTASSRSMNTASANDAAALATSRARWAGTAR